MQKIFKVPIIWKKSAKILTFTILILLIALLFVTACGVKVPEKYKRKWAKDTKLDGTCYKTMQMSGDELKILQLTDIHFDDHNNRKEWTLDLIFLWMSTKIIRITQIIMCLEKIKRIVISERKIRGGSLP